MSQLMPLQGLLLDLKQEIPPARRREYLPRDRALELLKEWTARILATMLPPGSVGSQSTVSGGQTDQTAYRGDPRVPVLLRRMILWGVVGGMVGAVVGDKNSYDPGLGAALYGCAIGALIAVILVRLFHRRSL
jgi:peptidoglycan/LPS O-acetylase OafA/YrhL